MKKLLSCIAVVLFIFCSISKVLAVDGYSFDLQYEGTVVKNQEKTGKVLLVGVNAPAYTNVRIKVEMTGPATPKVLATDETGTEYDIAQLGYWGPSAGFAVGGNFRNETPIKVTYPEEGTYTTTLSLIDVTNGNTVITSKTFTVQVYEDNTVGNVVSNTVTNEIGNIVNNNTIEELPKTGTSVIEYVMYIIGLVLILSIIGAYLNKRRING